MDSAKPRILVIGYGMLGAAVMRSPWTTAYTLVSASSTSRSADHILDIAQESQVKAFFDKQDHFDVVINCAALSLVDECEAYPLKANTVNGEAVGCLARACRERNMAFLQVSTDYVFDGENAPYSEEDPTAPCSAYAITKWIGEQFALNDADVAVVVRCTWLFGGERMDFVNGVIEKIKKGENLRIVDDQKASPTSVHDLAAAFEPLISKKLLPALKEKRKLHEIYHITNSGIATRKDMAKYLVELMGSAAHVDGITSRDIAAWKALRPLPSTVLSNAKYQKEFGTTLRDWKSALKAYVERK